MHMCSSTGTETGRCTMSSDSASGSLSSSCTKTSRALWLGKSRRKEKGHYGKSNGQGCRCVDCVALGAQQRITSAEADKKVERDVSAVP